MAIAPFAVWKPVAAHGGPMASVLGVVEHVTAGEGDPYNEFANPNNQVSSHFGIGNGQGGMADGLIEQYVDTAYDSWAQAAGNATYLSVETEGEPADPLTPAQVASFGQIMAWAHETYGVPLVAIDTVGQRGLIGHGDGGAAWGGHLGCPGPARLAQRPAILAAAAPAPPPVVVPPPTSSPRGDTVVLHTISIPTDGNGNGWVPTIIPWSAYLAISHQGSDPAANADDSYWPGEAHVQDRDGCVLVSVTHCLPGTTANVFVLANV